MPSRTRIGQVVCACDGLYATFEQSSDPMMLHDPADLRMVDCNPAYEQLVGYERDEIVGKPFYQHAVGYEQTPLEQVREIVRTLLHNPELVFTSQQEMMHSDGSTQLVSWSFTTVAVSGQNLFLNVGVPVDNEVQPSPLTTREREVVRLLALGKRGADIAAELFISLDTVETHTRNARLKLGAITLAGLVAKALSSGLI